MKIAGSLINQGFPFSVLAKCLQFFEKKCEENFEKVIRLDNWFPNRTWHTNRQKNGMSIKGMDWKRSIRQRLSDLMQCL